MTEGLGVILANYATFSSDIPWNIPRVTCIFWFTHEPLGECVYQENTGDEWDIPRLYHEKGLHNYFIPCQLNCTDRWEHSVKYRQIYNGFPAFWVAEFFMAWYKVAYAQVFLCWDCLYFLWHGINMHLWHSSNMHCVKLIHFIFSSVKLINSRNALISCSACNSIGEIGRNGPLPLPAGVEKMDQGLDLS